MKSRRSPAAAAVAALLMCGVVALTGCSSTTPAEKPADSPVQERLAGSMTELFEQQLQNPNLSEFEREVFERAVKTGSISQADYDEAFNRYEQCVSDLGYKDTWEKLPNGLYRITPPPLANQAAVDKYREQTEECADGTTMRIEGIFTQQQSNPNLNADPRAVAIQCLLKGGHTDASYTADDFERDSETGFQDAPFDVSDSDVQTCLYSAGYAIAG